MRDVDRRFTAVWTSVVLHIVALGLVLILRFPTTRPDERAKSISVMPIATTFRVAAVGKSASDKVKVAPINHVAARGAVSARVPKLEVGAFDRASKQAGLIPNDRTLGKVVVGILDSSSAAPAAVGPSGTVRLTNLFGSSGLGPGGTSIPEPQAADESAQLLSVPSPVYPEEGRRLNVSGEVVLAVKLTATGTVRILRIVCPLGHGFDQAAIEAVNQIRFRPARKGGRPIDVLANITVVFRLT